MTRNLLALAFISTITLTTHAQSTIKATDIIRQINDGKSVSYANVTIEGNLDLTDLDNRRIRHSSGWFGGNDVFESHVEKSVSFINCIFLGDVIAYYNNDHTDDTFIAHFDSDVTFRNCDFRRASEFKYSEFPEKVDFSGTTFNREANFKYAEFSEGPNFASVKFNDDANFKYTEFPRNTSFQKASFNGLANFKYSKFRSPLNIEAVAFHGQEDFKYTKVDGQSFTSYLLENR